MHNRNPTYVLRSSVFTCFAFCLLRKKIALREENILLLLASYCFYIIFLEITAYVIAQSSGIAIDPAQFATQCSFILILTFVLYLFINSYKDWLDLHHPDLKKEHIDQDIPVTEIPAKDSNKGHVFVCYNRVDSDEVLDLSKRIQESTDAKVWLDIHEIQPGEPWQEALRFGIKNSEKQFSKLVRAIRTLYPHSDL